jgi:very-long-chain ceramide synthase
LARSFSVTLKVSLTELAMSNPSAVVAIQNEKASTAHEWIERNEENSNSMEKKLNDGVSQAYPARPVVIDRKAKRKDDGPLEILCGWIVEHQIGRNKPLPIAINN